MTTKKILFIITQSEFGGAQRFLSTLLPKLDSEKFTVRVAYGLQDVPHLRRDIHPLDDIRAFFEIKKLITEFKPDTLFLLSSKAGFLGTLAANTRVIYRIGGWAFNDPRPAWQNFFVRSAERFLSGSRDIVIVNNKHDYDQAVRYGIKPRKSLELIYNGIDPYKLNLLPRGEAREKLGLSPNAFVVGTIANHYPSKGLEYFAQAKHLLASRPNIECVQLSKTPHADQYLSAFDVFVSPSVKEGFSWALLEAMAAKIPVIATRVGAAPEMIEDGKNGFLVEPRNAAVIAKKVLALLSNEQLRRQFSIEGHQTVLKKFDLYKMIEAIKALL